ncbi:hypothetical protein FKP32DRAFT_445707 [Trametes sanguinea]|nr:hypothetical protein FKP32DRAFT_445707 [Trametes sanguinea]
MAGLQETLVSVDVLPQKRVVPNHPTLVPIDTRHPNRISPFPHNPSYVTQWSAYAHIHVQSSSPRARVFAHAAYARRAAFAVNERTRNVREDHKTTHALRLAALPALPSRSAAHDLPIRPSIAPALSLIPQSPQSSPALPPLRPRIAQKWFRGCSASPPLYVESTRLGHI